MDEVYSLEQRVNYFLVDQEHRIRLGSLFQLFQEAAIHHANQYDIGTGIMHSRGESWILNRVALELTRYPKFQETVTVHTWATGLKHFKGFREFRVLVGKEELGRASTLWLYINLEKKSFARLPEAVEAAFPIRSENVFHPNLDKLRLKRPGQGADLSTVSLRYADIDGNRHVNNAAYMEMLQTALYHQNLDTRPKGIQIQFSKEISPNTKLVTVQLEIDQGQIRFSLGGNEETAAVGSLECTE